MDGVVNDADIDVMTQLDGGIALVMSQLHCESTVETLDLLCKHANAARLIEALNAQRSMFDTQIKIMCKECRQSASFGQLSIKRLDSANPFGSFGVK